MVSKTTELLNRVEKALLEGVPPVEIAFFSFSTTAVNEGLDRIIKRMNYKKNNFRYFKTLHAMAFSLLGLDTKQIISYGLMRQFAKENELKLNSIDYKTGVARYQTPDSILLSQIDSARLLGMTVREFFIKQHIDNVSIAHAEDIAAKYQKFKMANGVIDFTDMLLFANESVQDTPHFRHMFIDEAQDLSTQQWKFVEKMATNADNVVIVGDERQCQPAGEQVLTTQGFKNIEQLNSSVDTLVSYSRHDARCYGNQVFSIKEHEYTGYMYTIKTKRGNTKATAGHKWLVKWKDNKSTKLNAVYLMKKGDNFRIGWCQLFESNGSFHLNTRASKEQAEAVWILKVFDNKSEASIWESILATNYGISLLPFVEVPGAQHYSQAGLDFAYSNLINQKEKVITLLSDLNLDIRYPMLDRSKTNRHGCTMFECYSVNLIPELMEIPVRISNASKEWVAFDIEKEHVTTKVYGLDVPHYHTYITSNGIITHNCIAEFAGADVDYFLKVQGTLTELNRSYRVPRKIFNLARKIEKKMIKVRDSVWYPRGADPGETDADGEIIRINNLPIREMARGTWAVLTRTNSQLTEFKEYMMQNCHLLPAFFLVDGQPPVDEEIFKAISIFEGVTTKVDISKYDFILPDANDSEEKARKKVRYINLMKKFMSSKAPGTAELDTVFMHRFDYKNWTDAFDKVPLAERRYIAAILPVYKKHPDAFDKAKIRLSTIHSSKGTEADNVVLYTSLTSKVYNEWKRFAGTDDTEAKVLFVGVTRARKRLYLLGDKKAKYSYEEMIE